MHYDVVQNRQGVVAYGQSPAGSAMRAFIGVYSPRTSFEADLVGP